MDINPEKGTHGVSQEMQISSEMVGRDQELAKLELHIFTLTRHKQGAPASDNSGVFFQERIICFCIDEKIDHINGGGKVDFNITIARGIGD